MYSIKSIFMKKWRFLFMMIVKYVRSDQAALTHFFVKLWNYFLRFQFFQGGCQFCRKMPCFLCTLVMFSFFESVNEETFLFWRDVVHLQAEINNQLWYCCPFIIFYIRLSTFFADREFVCACVFSKFKHMKKQNKICVRKEKEKFER